MARMPKILRQMLQQNDAADEQVAVQDEADANASAQETSSSETERTRDDESGQSFWQTLAGVGEASESAQSAARSETEARVNGDAGDQLDTTSVQQDGSEIEAPLEAAAAQAQPAGQMDQGDEPGTAPAQTARTSASNASDQVEAPADEQGDASTDRPAPDTAAGPVVTEALSETNTVAAETPETSPNFEPAQEDPAQQADEATEQAATATFDVTGTTNADAASDAPDAPDATASEVRLMRNSVTGAASPPASFG